MTQIVRVVEAIKPLSDMFDTGSKFIETHPNSNVYRPIEHPEGYVGLMHQTFGHRFSLYFKSIEPMDWEDHINFKELEQHKQERLASIANQMNDLETERNVLLNL